MPLKPVIIVTGPTATGKSALALALARAFSGLIINADSMQIYADLTIVTARPEAAALNKAPHALYGILPGAERCSAARWLGLALAAIAAAHENGLLPIVTGGTGLYLRALTAGLAQIPDVPEAVRRETAALLVDIGTPGLHAALAARDADGAARLAVNDTQRIRRAWEVLAATGRPLGAWLEDGRGSPPEGLRFLTLALLPPREVLYAACDGRFVGMMRAGALDEVRRLAAAHLPENMPILKALGVPELRRHLAGDLHLDTAITLAQQSTRNYAKRQVTWFRHQLGKDGAPLHQINEQFSERLLPEIISIIREFI